MTLFVPPLISRLQIIGTWYRTGVSAHRSPIHSSCICEDVDRWCSDSSPLCSPATTIQRIQQSNCNSQYFHPIYSLNSSLPFTLHDILQYHDALTPLHTPLPPISLHPPHLGNSRPILARYLHHTPHSIQSSLRPMDHSLQNTRDTQSIGSRCSGRLSCARYECGRAGAVCTEFGGCSQEWCAQSVEECGEVFDVWGD